MTTPVPLISAMPQFNPGTRDDLAASSPVYQALLAQTGGKLGNVNSLAASQPSFAPGLALMGPGGGLNPAQASQFGPLFSLMMALQGGGQMGQGQL